MPVTIRLRDAGPLVIEGEGVTIIDAEGNEFQPPGEKPLIALCRCGSSRQRPFCDGSHKQCGFQAIDRAKPS